MNKFEPSTFSQKSLETQLDVDLITSTSLGQKTWMFSNDVPNYERGLEALRGHSFIMPNI